LAKELLHESGSVFVQISDDNLHHVRELLDEVFAPGNFCSVITFRKTSGANSPTARTEVLAATGDYFIWYPGHRSRLKYRQIYENWTIDDDYNLRWVEFSDGRRERLKSVNEIQAAVEQGAKVFRPNPLTSQTAANSISFPFEFEGKQF